MRNFDPARSDAKPSRYARLLAFFWIFLLTTFLLSFWT